MAVRRVSGKKGSKIRRWPGKDSVLARGGKRWLLVLGLAVCGAIAVAFVARPLGRGDHRSQLKEKLEAKEQPLAASQPFPSEPARESPPPAELEPLPAEPEPLPPESAPSLPDPTAPTRITEEGLKQEAMDAVRCLVGDFPKSADPMGLLGELYVALGDTTAAVKCWEKCIELDSHCTDAYRLMAEVALQKGQFETAAGLSRKALAIDPAVRGVHNQLAQALIGLGKPKEAIAELQEDIKISPRASLSHFLLGQAHQQLRQYQEAKQGYQKALEIDPKYTEASYGLSLVCARLGEQKEAQEYRKKFKELKAHDWRGLADPRDALDQEKFLAALSVGVAQTHTKVGLVYRQFGEGAKAERLWRRAAILDPRNIVCREELAILYAGRGRNRDALRLYRQLQKIAPNNPQYHLRTGILYARMNQTDSALSAVKRALEMDPGNVEYRRIYERLQERN